MKVSSDFSGMGFSGDLTNPFSERGTPETGPADEELVAAAQAGDKDALEKLVRRHQPWVFNPLLQMPSAIHLSFFASIVFGTPGLISDVPLQAIVDRAASGLYKAKPAKVFRFEEIQDAHRLMESNRANGKLVIRL
jgi:hypothetical protein